MSSFLSKVFGRKKDDKESPRLQGRASDGSLLEGKYEAVSPTVSPLATHFSEVTNGKSNLSKEKEKDLGFALFKAKSRTSSSDPPSQKRLDLPHLSLNLPGPKEDSNSRALGVVFEGDCSQLLLADSVIGERRLNPLETLVLVRACSQAIAARGLETLGIMHPHWYSASPETQRKLISLFIQSLAPKSPITTLSPTRSAAVSAFESEINFTRSPHDVAAVLRWGLRHLQLEGNSFGKDDAWYQAFFGAERTSEYPPRAFSDKLVPLLPPAHLELLTATLEVFSSLAAHAEANSTSSGKLSKVFGLWLLTTLRVEDKDDWFSFYARWERTGRILEHLFLSRIRDEAAGHRMPTRLLELVHHYPYNTASTLSSDANLLSRPQFSTRRYDALFVRIDTELSDTADKPKHHPLRLIAEAFKGDTSVVDASEYTQVWEKIRKAGSNEENPSPGAYPGLSRIFADETIRFLSLIPFDNATTDPVSPTFSLFLPHRSAGGVRRRSFSLSDKDKAIATATAANGAVASRHNKASTDSPASPTTSSVGIDWAHFSTSGFLESSSAGAPLATTLLDKDIEVTVPRENKRAKISLSYANRKSVDVLPSAAPTATTETMAAEVKLVPKLALASLVPLDEAFIDFWSDALLDPISANWPPFVVCKLKSSIPGLAVGEKRIEWLVIEQSFSKPATSVTASAESHASSPPPRRARPSSPKPSFRSDISGTFSSTRKRFSFFGSPTRASTERPSTKGKTPKKAHRVGEMGEVLPEEDEKVTDTLKSRIPSPKPKQSMDLPRKSSEPAKSGGEGKKSNGLGVAGVAAAVVAQTVPEAFKATEPKASVQPPATEAPILTTAPVSAKETRDPTGPEHHVQSHVADSLAPVVEETLNTTVVASPPPAASSTPLPDTTAPRASLAAQPTATPEVAAAAPVLSEAAIVPEVVDAVDEEVAVAPTVVEAELTPEVTTPPVPAAADEPETGESSARAAAIVVPESTSAPEVVEAPIETSADAPATVVRHEAPATEDSAPAAEVAAEAPAEAAHFAEEPAAEEPVVEEPVVKESAVEEPVVEQPVVKELAVEEIATAEKSSVGPAVVDSEVPQDGESQEPTIQALASDTTDAALVSLPDIPVVEAEPVPIPPNATPLAVELDAHTPEPTVSQLPPGLGNVMLSGATPGPELALTTDEHVADTQTTDSSALPNDNGSEAAPQVGTSDTQPTGEEDAPAKEPVVPLEEPVVPIDSVLTSTETPIPSALYKGDTTAANHSEENGTTLERPDGEEKPSPLVAET